MLRISYGVKALAEVCAGLSKLSSGGGRAAAAAAGRSERCAAPARPTREYLQAEFDRLHRDDQ